MGRGHGKGIDSMSAGLPRGARLRVAAEAARIIADQDFVDYAGARRKAAARLRVTDRRQWPDDSEIADALAAYRSLFQASDHDAVLTRLRRSALNAMEMLADFSPRLVGAVRDGTAGQHSPVRLHLFADSAKNVLIGLLDRRIPIASAEVRLRFPDGSAALRPALRFAVDGVDIEAVLLDPADRSRPPLDSLSGRPEPGLTAAEVELLLPGQERSDEGR